MITASSHLYNLGHVTALLFFGLLFLGLFLLMYVGIKAILKDGKTRRRLEKQRGENPNITITFRRDA